MPIFTNDIKTYNKKTLNDKIYRLTTINVQLITNKMKTEKIKVNLETNKAQLFDKKNFLIAKRKKLRIKIVILNIAGPFNISIHNHQNPLLKSIQDKFKTK